MDADAKWIWLDGASRDRTVLFQREVSLEAFSESCIRITADSRYRLWVNDTWIGDGPARAYPGHYRYDVHDLSRFLSEGQNRIDVRVMHAGDDNFQYIVSEAGLLCSLEVDGETVLLSDESWDVSDVPEVEPRAPRIAQQQFPMEIVDLSRRERMWQPPNAVRSQKEDPHNGLIPRDVQLLSRVPINFGHFVAASVVTAPEHVFTFRSRRIFYPESTSANILPAMGCFLTVLEAESDGRLDLQCGGIQNIFLDGCELPLECVLDSSELVMRTEEVCISAGRHLLTLVSNVDYYPTDAFLACRSAVCLTWRSPMSESGSPWVFSGILWQAPEDTNLFDDVPDEQMRFNPYPRWRWPRDRMDEMMALAGCAGVDDIIERSPAPRPLAHDELCACDPTIEVLFGSEHADTPKMSSPEACLKVGAESTMIQPCKEGDVQVVYDLDDLSVGYFDMEIDAPEGTVVDAYFAEHIEDGHIQIPGLLRNGFRIVCQEGQNHFTAGRRFGMRFALLVFRQFNRPLRLHRIRVIETTYPDSGTDRFACSDERLTRIHQISRRTLLLCMEDTFTDCPTYEQVLWIGDAANEARYAFNTFGAYDLAKRCCRIGAESLNHLPLVASQAPSGWNILLPAWSFLWNINVWETWFYSGDRGFLKELYPALKQNTDSALGYLDDRGLFSIKAWNMFDWTNVDHEHRTVVHNSMFLIAALDAAACTARELEQDEDADRWHDAGLGLRKAVNACWLSNEQAYTDAIREDGRPSPSVSRHTSMLSLLYDIVPNEHREAAIRNALEGRDGMVDVGSPFAMSFFLQCFEKLGEHDRILRVIRDYWGLMIDHDARTCWECIDKDWLAGKAEWPTRSRCHGWSASPLDVFARIILGVRPLKPGFAEVAVHPVPCGLAHAEGCVPTPHGPINVKWRVRDDGVLDLNVEAPDGVEVKRSEPHDLGANHGSAFGHSTS